MFPGGPREGKGPPRHSTRPPARLALAALLAVAAPARAATPAEDLALELTLTPLLLDYELPGHPRRIGWSHTGVTGEVGLRWRPSARLELSAGVLGRFPFAVDPEDEAAVAPQLSLTAWPFGPALLVRFGSLDLAHGFHPAVLDEAAQSYGRPVEEAYHRALAPAARRDLGRDLRMPVEQGAQAILSLPWLWAEAYLDWQLLETAAHREKFAFGALAELRSDAIDAGAQVRGVHYGGQRFTATDPPRRQGLDPKRQPVVVALFARPRVALGPVRLEAPITLLGGSAVQVDGEREPAHGGLEVGLDVRALDGARLGYRLWLPRGGRAAFLGEDGDPVYAGPRSHRAVLELVTPVGLAELRSRLDLVFADGADKVQYLLVGALAFRWEAALLGGAAPQPGVRPRRRRRPRSSRTSAGTGRARSRTARSMRWRREPRA
jgi:hypothetical protein